MNWYKKANFEYRKIGEMPWFEYHCNESPNSPDAPAWYRSHQKVKVLNLVEKGNGRTKKERIEDMGEPAVYNVEFTDGLTWDVFEDELVDSPNEFYRPDPPKEKI